MVKFVQQMSLRFYILCFWLLPGLSSVAQPILSPKLVSDKKELRTGFDRITLQVKNIEVFRSKYPGAEILFSHRLSNALVVRLATLDLEEVKKDENVIFLDIPGKPTEESYLERVNFSFNRIRKAQGATSFLWGDGITLSMKEGAFNPDDIDLAGRSFATALTSSTSSQHATEMATIVAGAGNLAEENRGVVPYATLTSSDYANLLPDEESFFSDYSIHIQNHSYGVNVENYYGVEAVAYDASVFAFPTHLHVFSSGNFGTVSPESGTYVGIRSANLSGTFKQAKNVLVVNAVDSTYSVNVRNSIGPAYDGRLKPELTAYGSGGTSEAAALVSGSAGFLSQLILEKNEPQPEAALLKAILIAGADDIGAPGPDFQTGYGSLNLSTSKTIVENDHYQLVTLLPDSTYTFEIPAPAGVASIKIVTVWHEPAGPIDAPSALIHDIDTKVYFEGATFLPWVLSSYPSPDSLNALGKRGKDHLNNVELITITNPEAGTYTLQIEVPDLTTDSQPVAVAWSLEEADSFEWDFPTFTSKPQAGESIDLLWTTTFIEPGNLDLNVGGLDWQRVGSNLDLSTIYQLALPDTSTLCQLRMSIGADEFVTSPFVVSRKIETDFSFICEDQVGFIWRRIPEADGYHVYRMGDTQMELIAATADTSIVAEKSGSPFFAVSPLIIAEGNRSLAIDYSFSGTFCYIDFFAAERTIDDRVLVRLQLSTIDKIEHIEVVNMHHGESTLLATVVPESLSIEVEDEANLPGRNQYQATLHFVDQSTLVSDMSELYLEDPGKAILFPNPSTSSTLNILSDGTGQTIRIYDQNGRFLFQKELFYTYDELIIYDLEPGNYFYRLLEFEEEIGRGRFVKY